TGLGITPEDLQQIFHPFFQTSSGQRKQEGTGLGLSISQKFIDLMGGSIQVQSQVGHGTTFAFSIQAAVEQVQQSLNLLPLQRSSEPQERAAAPLPTAHQSLDPARLAALPPEILKDLEFAAVTTDITQLKTIIDHIRSHALDLAEDLQYLTDHFEYTKILTLLHQAEERHQKQNTAL
ncbi:hypothetical protein GF339_19940, partial [candidate division KSB3 bacterium]|nr:hypothetical protein [candidate division KSB3 bacterium]MBD3326866.1 hypothetical protein [candidate division KSB3 bacterium]